MRFDPIPSVGDHLGLDDPLAPPRRLQLVALSDGLVATFFDMPTEANHPVPMSALAGDEGLCKRMFSSRLAKRDGGVRHVFFIARAARDLCRAGLRITRADAQNGPPVAEIDPSALQSPVVDALALVVGLAPEGERRLLSALVTTGPSLFGEAAFSGLGDLVGPLLERLAPPPLPLSAWVPLGGKAAIASYGLPRDLEINIGETLVALRGGQASRLTGIGTELEAQGEDRLLHLYLPEGVAEGATLVALTERPLRFDGPLAETRPRPLGPWLERRTPSVRRKTRARLTTLAEADRTAAALVAEVGCPAAALPQVTPHVMARTGAGVFYAVGLSDPRRLLDGLVLRTEAGDVPLPLGPAQHHPQFGPVHLGYAPEEAIGEAAAEAVLYALYRSGRLSRVGPVAMTTMDRAVPEGLEALPAQALAGPLAAALSDTLGERPAVSAEVLTVAAPVAPPRVTLLVALGQSLDYPYALAASLGGRRDVVLRLLSPDPRALAGLYTLGQELHAIYGIGVDLLDIADQSALPAERMRAAVAGVETEAVIVLSGDMFSIERFWLEAWERALTAPGPVLSAAEVAEHGGGLPEAQRAGALLPVDARAFGLNAAACARMAEMPLRVGGQGAFVDDLAGALLGAAGVGALPVPCVAMTAFARPSADPEALVMAEQMILKGGATT